jgi:uncharacterized protein DUF3253
MTEPADLRAAVLDLLAQRDEGRTICPSDVARAVHGGADDGWRALMDPVRAAAAELAAEGSVEVTQGGRRVDIRTARGPVRIGRPSIR